MKKYRCRAGSICPRAVGIPATHTCIMRVRTNGRTAGLSLLARAADLHAASVLQAGDARHIYMDQYAFGKRGQFSFPGGALVPGQEDPRSLILGQTLQLNIQGTIRNPLGYYAYADVFEETHRQGGVTGYAHVIGSSLFHEERGMTINVPSGKVDFAEISHVSAIQTGLYYEFLNLGFRLAASAGSDTPMLGEPGQCRVYVNTGGIFDPDRRFAGLREGRTFVTTGALLDFPVDARGPGTILRFQKGQTVAVHASVLAPLGTSPRPGEIVANGDVIRSGTNSINFSMVVGESMWIAARTKDAHTSPVYIPLEGKRHWKRATVPELLRKRLAFLDEVEKLTARDVAPGRDGNWGDADSFVRGATALRSRIAEARVAYEKRSGEWERECGADARP